MKEIWKDIPGYEGLYQVSTLGRIISYQRKNPIFLKQNESIEGYKKVTLTKNTKRKPFLVHRIVAITFIPNPYNKPEVNHLDENKANNSVSNLEWVTPLENTHWGTVIERRAKSLRNTSCNKAVYQYDRSLNFIKKYISCAEAARQNGFHRTGITSSCNKKKHFEHYKGYFWSYVELEKEVTE